MSKIARSGSHKPGFIYRIALENFMTYKEIELFPGNNMNLIIGPNGSGKSTFVAAIILGLGGNLGDVSDKNKSLIEYIKRNTNKAKIEIELYDDRKERVIIKSEISKLNNNKDMKRYINNTEVTKKKLLEFTKKLNIQVGNLCQLLPQTKVMNFIKLTDKELLASTASAASVNLGSELVRLKENHKSLQAENKKNKISLKEKEKELERFGPELDKFREKQRLDRECKICDNKKLWLDYKHTNVEIKKYEKKVTDNTQLVRKCEQDIKPFMDKINDISKKIDELENCKKSISTKIFNDERVINKIKESIAAKQRKFAEIRDEFTTKEEEKKNKVNEIRKIEAKLEMYMNSKKSFIEKNKTESELQAEIKTFEDRIKKSNMGLNQLNGNKMDIELDLNTITSEISALEYRMNRLRNMKENKLNRLSSTNPDTYKAIQWLRQNKSLFNHAVYEPMMFEIKFSDQNDARYLENIVANRDLIAFTFECEKDMKLFLTEVRTNLKYGLVNAVCSGRGPTQTPDDIRKYRHLGFSKYVSETFEAPDAIRRYLCNQYKIHNIPIGNRHTYENNEHVPSNIQLYFADNYRFFVKKSKYSGKTSKSISEINKAVLLDNIIDENDISEINNRLSSCSSTKNTKIAALNKINEKITVLNNQVNDLREFINSRNTEINKVRNIDKSIKTHQQLREQLIRNPDIDLDEAREICKRKNKLVVKEQCQLQKELLESYKKLHISVLHYKDIASRINHLNYDKDTAAPQLMQLQTQLTDKKASLKESQRQLNMMREEANKKIIHFKSLYNGKIPTNPDFPDKEQFRALPSNEAALAKYRIDIETRKNLIPGHSTEVLQRCEQLQQDIESLRVRIRETEAELSEMQNNFDGQKTDWLENLNSLIQRLTARFSELMAKLKFAGEIVLDKPEDEDDLINYGIKIMVKYRPEDQLNALSRLQSGGERALATALYLLALQSEATVPFRCLDEINQGVDARNERKLMGLLIDVTTRDPNCQYFLLTPKLLKNLEYNPSIKVHVVMKGNPVVHHTKWDFDTFLQKARS